MAFDPAKFRKTLVYQAKAPIAEILTDLNSMEQIDRISAKKRQKVNQILIIAILLGVAIFILAVMSGNPLAFGIGSCLAVLICLPSIVYASIVKGQYQRVNLSGYRYGILPKLLDSLGRDLDPSANLNLNVVLSQPDQSQKQVSTSPHPHKRGWKVKRFEDRWLAVEGTFLDGSRFQLASTENYVRQEGWKRSRSGKSKFKSKSKSKGLLWTLALSFPKRKYGALPALSQTVREAIKLPNETQLKQVNIRANKLALACKMSLDCSWSNMPHNMSFSEFQASQQIERAYQTVTMMFLSVYQVANLARKLSKKA